MMPSIQLFQTSDEPLKLRRNLSCSSLLLYILRPNLRMNLDYTSHMFNLTLIIFEDKALEMAGRDLKHLGLPPPQRNSNDRLNREMLRETSYDGNQLNKYVGANASLLVVH